MTTGMQTAGAGPIRVLLVDDHHHVLWGLGKLIEGEWPHMVLAGTATTVREAQTFLRGHGTDVIVLDIYLGRENSLDRLPWLLEESGARAVVLTGARDTSLHRRALRDGATAVVMKDAPAEVLLTAIRKAHAAAPVSQESHRNSAQPDVFRLGK